LYQIVWGVPGKVAQQATSLLYAGEHFDTDMQNYYNRARWYNPLTGLFNRMDPYEGNRQAPQSLHKYLYAHCNPVMNIDPSGNIVGLAPSPTISLLTSTTIQADLRSTQTISYKPIYYRAMMTVGAMLAIATVAIYTQLLTYELLALNLSMEIETRTSPILYNEIKARKALVTAVAHAKAAEQVAKQFSHKIGISSKEIEDLPIFFVLQSKTPYIYEHDMNAIAGNPLWIALQYYGPDQAHHRANRRAATAGKDYLRTEQLPELDEYPFASTFQGGAGASVAAVPKSEHITQRVHLSLFYRSKLNYVPRWFLVVPLPL
jgi:RHS repeat-associated protein